MKYLSTLLVVASLTASTTILADDTSTTSATSAPVAAEENNNSAITELCNTYAQEDGITESKKSAYLKKCMASMTDLSESMQENLPATSETTGEVVAVPSSEQVNNSPENLVQNELVETPDPAAEQLSAIK
jgi:hypothetical protein